VRLSLDLDGVSQLRLLTTYFNLARFTDKLELFVTSVENNRENYHINAYDLPTLEREKSYEFRASLGDDESRIWLDRRLYEFNKPQMVLLNRRVKWNRKSLRWETNYRWRLLSILWKPWISKLPARKPKKRR